VGPTARGKHVRVPLAETQHRAGMVKEKRVLFPAPVSK
jgi:hypothetical protein